MQKFNDPVRFRRQNTRKIGMVVLDTGTTWKQLSLEESEENADDARTQPAMPRIKGDNTSPKRGLISGKRRKDPKKSYTTYLPPVRAPAGKRSKSKKNRNKSEKGLSPSKNPLYSKVDFAGKGVKLPPIGGGSNARAEKCGRDKEENKDTISPMETGKFSKKEADSDQGSRTARKFLSVSF